jgi:two-component system, OmpR family, response regulator
MGKKTVLVVDDDEDICTLLTEALEGEGHTVHCALGSAVLPLAQDTQPAVILLDVMMPTLDGATLSRLLRAHPRTGQIPIVAMSAMPRRNAPAGLRYDAWLGKPFDLRTLFAMIDAMTPRCVPALAAGI